MQKGLIIAFSETRRTIRIRLVKSSPPVCKCRKQHSEDCRTGAQNRIKDVTVDFSGPDFTMKAAAVPSNVHPAGTQTYVIDSIVEGTTNALETMRVPNNTTSKNINAAEPIEVGFTTLPFSAFEENPKKFRSVHSFKNKSYETV